MNFQKFNNNYMYNLCYCYVDFVKKDNGTIDKIGICGYLTKRVSKCQKLNQDLCNSFNFEIMY